MTKEQERLLRDSTFNRCADDEPIFILRAQDATAPLAVIDWINRASRYGADLHKVNEAMALAVQMIEWQIAHHDRVKVPDAGPRRYPRPNWSDDITK